jgi:hydroxypyruvate reductase
LIVIGAGKASAAMARAVEQHWPGPLSGLVITRYGHTVPCERIEIVEAAHPVPDAAGEAAALRLLQTVQGLSEDDLVLALISGGGSALMAAPAEGVSLAEKRALTSALLKSGAAIDEINCVRKHLSAGKGGRLALAAWPASVLTLAISDVPGDDPAVIASGPTVPDPTTCADALAVLDRYAIAVPPALRARLEAGELETPKPGDPRLARSTYRMIASPAQMLAAAAEAARQQGVMPLILGDAIEGEAREVARAFAGIALSAR